MAVVTGPLFSIDASGQFARSMVYGKWKGINTCKFFSEPGGDSTARQDFVRNIFSLAVTKYHRLSGYDKEAWNKRAAGTPMSGYNLFMKQVMANLTAGVNRFNVIHDVEAKKILSTSAEFEVNIDEAAPFQVRWGERGKSLQNRILIAAEQIIQGSFSFTIAELRPAMEYAFRVIQEPILVNPPEEAIITLSGADGVTLYEFLISSVTSKDEEVLNTSLIHSIENGPADVDDLNRIELSWDPVIGASRYFVYLVDRNEQLAYQLARTSNTSFAFRGEEPLGYIELAPDWHYPQEVRPITYIVGESGDYEFMAAQ